MNITAIQRKDFFGSVAPSPEDLSGDDTSTAIQPGALNTRARNLERARSGGSSDTVFLSETAIALASGMLASTTEAARTETEQEEQHFAYAANGGLRSYSGYKAYVYAKSLAQRAQSTAVSASLNLFAPQVPASEEAPEREALPENIARHASNTLAASAVGKLQDRLRALQQELQAVQNNSPQHNRLSHMTRLSSQITQIMQEINSMMRQE